MFISPGLLRQYAVVFIVNLSMITTGMSLAWPSPVLVKLKDSKENPLSRLITDDEASWMVSLGFLLTAVTNIIGSAVNDAIGRKYSLLLGHMIKTAMSILLVCSTKVWMLIFGRTVMIIADCFIFTIVPVYASEIASKEQHDTLGSFLQIFSTLGAVATLSVGPFTSYTTFNIFFMSLLLITTLPILALPESPYFLYAKGRIDEASTVLTSLRASESEVTQEILRYKESSTVPDINRISLLRDPSFLKSLVFAVLLGVGSQIIGSNAILFYLQPILESTNSHIQSEIGSVIIGIIQVLAAGCTYACISKFGRRRVLLSTLSGYFLGMVGLGTFFKLIEPEGYQIVGFLNYLPLISLIVSIFCMSAGMSTLVWPIISDSFEGRTRTFGVSITLIFLNFLIFLVTKYFPLVTIVVGPAIAYWFFAAMTAILIVLLVFYLPASK